MTVLASVQANCWRDGRFWVVSLPETRRTALTEDWSDVESVARSLAGLSPDRLAPADSTSAVQLPMAPPSTPSDLGWPSEEETASVSILVSDRITEGLQAAAASQDDADRMSVEAVAARRDRARRLAAEGVDLRHIASLLGVSFARAQQLVGSARAHARAPSPRANSERSIASPAVRLPRRARHAEPTVAALHSLNAGGKARKAHDGYRHEAMLYRDDDEFIAGVLPFVLDGLAHDEPVMVAVAEPRLSLVRDALGMSAERTHLVDMAQLGRNPARIIPGWRQFIADQSRHGRPVRGIGEPIWAERSSADLAECQLHEALLNVAIDPDVPLWLRCPYDVAKLPQPVLDEAMRSHPTIVEGDSYRGSTTYVGLLHVEELFAGSLARPAERLANFVFGSYDFDMVRKAVTQVAEQAGLSARRRRDLLVAVSEVVVNSVQHGGGSGQLAVWRDEQSVIVEISDAGQITDPLVGRRKPSHLARRGRGLWLANQLSDLLRIRSTVRGTTVRMHFDANRLDF